MRIIGNIEHPALKITVFDYENRVSIKFETGLYEQTYKFRTGGLVNNLEEAQAFVNEELLEKVMQQVQQMHQLKTERLGQLHAASEEEFDEII